MPEVGAYLEANRKEIEATKLEAAQEAQMAASEDAGAQAIAEDIGEESKDGGSPDMKV